MDNRLIVLAANHARIDAARAWLQAHAGTGGALIVAPSHRAADDFARMSCGPGAASIGLYRATLIQLAGEMAALDLAKEGRATVSALGVEAVAQRCVHGAREENALAYFAPVAHTPGFSRALARTLLELRLAQVASDDLRRGGGESGQDLAHLKERYEAELDRQRLADVAGVLAAATRVAEAGAHRLAGIPILFADVSPGSKAEADLIARLCARAPAVLATIGPHDPRGLAFLENALGTTARGTEEGRRETPRTVLEAARRFVFETEQPEAKEADGTLEVFSAPGEGREAIEIARRIVWEADGRSEYPKSEIRSSVSEGSSVSQGDGPPPFGFEISDLGPRIFGLSERTTAGRISFDRIAILLRDPDRYQPLIEEALARAGIPAFFTHGTVRPDPAGRALLALLACASEGLSASRFAEYLSLGQVPRPGADGNPVAHEVPWVVAKDDVQLVFRSLEVPSSAPGAASSAEASSAEPGAQRRAAENDRDAVIEGGLQAPHRWEELLVDAAVIGKRDRWQRRLRGLDAELTLQIAALESPDSADREHLERERERLAHLTRFALPLIAQLDRLPKQALWGEWLRALESLAAMALARTESVARVLAELRPMAEVGPVGLDEVREVLLERLTLLRDEPPARRYGKVFVATIEEAALRTFELVFLPGLAEGVFPKKRFEDPLLLDAARREVSPYLEVQATRSARERTLLATGLGAAKDRLVISYPRLDVEEGRPRVPSFYALDVLRAAEGRLPDLRELEKRAARASDARLGWPAPNRVEDAIDDAEYDLALLGELGARPKDETAGLARYLMSVNPHLARSLRASAGRPRAPWTQSDGLFQVDPARANELAELGLKARAYGVTDLQLVAACPYRFLLHAVQRLRPRRRIAPLETLDPRTRGNLFHEAQFRAFEALKERAFADPDGPPAPLATLLEAANAALDRVAADYEEALAPSIPPVWKREIEAVRKDLAGWVRGLADDGIAWRPIRAELAFGSSRREQRDPRSTPDPVTVLDGIRLKGAIDLVEEDRSTRALRVTDHKTGKVPPELLEHVGGGEQLQPLLYALAAEKLIERPVSSARLYYCTARGGYEQREIAIDGAAREAIVRSVSLIDRLIEGGVFVSAPKKGACEYCDFRPVCGPNEEDRVRHKDRSPLALLDSLRSER